MPRHTPSTVLLALLVGPLAAQVFGPQPTFERVPQMTRYANTHAMSGDGRRLAFLSADDPAGSNPDGNLEVFVYDLETRTTSQITRTTASAGYTSNDWVQTNVDGTRLVIRSRFPLHTGAATPLPGRDLFLATVDYGVTPPRASFQRITTTDEQLAFALSGDGSKLALVSEHDLVGQNGLRKAQLFLYNLAPAVSLRQLTAFAEGLISRPWDAELCINFDGSWVGFTSDRDRGDNAEQNREVYVTNTAPPRSYWQASTSPAGVTNREPRCVGSLWPRVAFTSNGDMAGANPDGNREIFLADVGGAGNELLQVTNTQGGELSGGANRSPQLDPDGLRLAFSSNRDLTPARGSASGNADGNREIFVAELPEGPLGPPIGFRQITNTTTAQPGTRLENVYPSWSTNGTRIGFNSDLDLGVTGTSSLYVARVPEPPTGSPPSIGSFSPDCAGPGVPIVVKGANLLGATRVRFGDRDALSFRVVTRNRIVAVVPTGVARAPIRLTTPLGEAATQGDFVPAELEIFGVEVNQGVADYLLVAGKDTLVRVLAGAHRPGDRREPGRWLISDARLTVVKPSGATVEVGPTMASEYLTNGSRSFSELDNINFFVSGDLIDEPGDYSFQTSASTLGRVVHARTERRSFLPTRDLTMVLRTLQRNPNEEEMRDILGLLEELSRTYPIRRGIGSLRGTGGASDRAVGLRVALAPPFLAGVDPSAQYPCPNQSCFDWLLTDLSDLVTAINVAAGFEDVEFAVALMLPDRLLSNEGEWQTCQPDEQNPPGFGFYGVSVEELRSSLVTMCLYPGMVLPHEVGHLHGLVPEGAPNSTNDGTSHSVNGAAADRGFNLLTRRLVETPISLMTSGGAFAAEVAFFENKTEGGQNVDYPFLVTRRVLLGSPAAPSALAAVDGGDAPRFVFMARQRADGSISLRHASVAGPGRATNGGIPAGDLRLAFLDAAGRVLAEAAVQAVDPARDGGRDRRPDAPPRTGGELALVSVHALPAGTSAVELRRRGETLYRLRPGSGVPSLIVRRPVVEDGPRDGRQVHVGWQARDPDGDALTYQVELSREGGPYFPVVPATDLSGLTLPVGALPGGRSLRFRVIASDGLHVNKVVSPAFSLPEHEPTAAITSIRNGDQFRLRESIPLRGLAYDAEDGVLGDSRAEAQSLEWSVDDERILGHGTEAVLRGDDVGSGWHRITLVASDSSGRKGTHTVRIHVVPHNDPHGPS